MPVSARIRIEPELHARIDSLILEQGVFAPLELLFACGYLMHADYERWRRREVPTLDGVFMGQREEICAKLERAVAYAVGLGFQAQAQEFLVWGSAAPGEKRLKVSDDAHLHQLICGRYVPGQQAPQMDLFFDSPVGSLVNGIVQAICTHNPAEARRQLAYLCLQAPDHPHFAAFDQLIQALEHIDHPLYNPLGEFEFLLRIGPAAKQLLGPHARDLLSPLWRQLGQLLRESAFLPERPALHASYAFGQAEDWQGVSESVLSVPEWWVHPVLCGRLTESAVRRHRRTEALTAWFHLCWRAPDEAAESSEILGQSELADCWLEFLDTDEEIFASAAFSTPALTPADFPAWMLLAEPRLARHLPVELAKRSTPGEEHYRCVHDWIHAYEANRTADEMALRKLLQTTQPTLFGMLRRLARLRTTAGDRDARYSKIPGRGQCRYHPDKTRPL